MSRVVEFLRAAFHAPSLDSPPRERVSPYVREAVTRAELEAREKARSAPHAELHLRPGGGLEAEAHRETDNQNERRIRFIRERLAAQQDHAGRDFARTRMMEK